MLEEKKLEYDELVENVLDSDGELPAEEYNALANTLMGKKHEYVEAAQNKDNITKGLITRWTNMASSSLKAYKNFRQDLAAAYNTKTLMNTWIDSPDGKAIMGLLKNEQRLVEKTCIDDANCANKNELGVLMPDFRAADIAKNTLLKLDDEFQNAPYNVKRQFEVPYMNERNKLLQQINSSGQKWVSINNLKKRIKLIDKGTRDALNAMGNNYLTQSTQTNPADNIPFNRPAAERQIRGNILGRASNFQSLIYDDMGPGPFIENFPLKIKNETGIKDDNQVKRIADEIIKNKDHKKLLDDELTNYFVGFLQKQWNMGKRNRPNPTNIKNEVKNADGSIDWKPERA